MTIEFQNGEVYEGDMKGGLFQGRGKMSHAKEKGGGYYDGMWFKGKKQGRGVRVYSDGSKFVGDFFEGEIEGSKIRIRIRLDCTPV